MTIPTLPTWVDQEIQSAGKLNLISSGLETKFAGAIGGADLAWPLVAQGTIDMNGYSLIGLKKFWNVFNVDEYTDIQTAMDAAEAAGGSGLFIPPNNVNNDAEGLTMSETVHVFGAGKKSIIYITLNATAGQLLKSASSPSDCSFSNLVLDGRAVTGAGQDGIVLENVDGCIFDRVVFRNFSGDALVLNNEGTAGNQCSDITVMGCKFEGGTGDHIVGNDIDGLNVIGCQFLNPGSDGIVLTPDDAASKMRGIQISNNRFTLVARAISVVGQSGTANDLWRLVQITDNQVLTASGIAITAGTASAVLKYVTVKNNILIATSQGLRVQGTYGDVCGNYAPSTTGTQAIDATDCQDMTFQGNRVPDATGIGIETTNSDDCRFVDNDVHGAGGVKIVKVGTTGNEYRRNLGDEIRGHIEASEEYDQDNPDDSGNSTKVFTIPANSVTAGDVIRVQAVYARSGTGSTASLALELEGTATIGITVATGSGTTVIEWLIYVVATDGDTDLQCSAVIEIASALSQTNVIAAVDIDWTADVDLTFPWVKHTADTVNILSASYQLVGTN